MQTSISVCFQEIQRRTWNWKWSQEQFYNWALEGNQSLWHTVAMQLFTSSEGGEDAGGRNALRDTNISVI